MQKVIISLTSYPARIGIVDQVIESLFKQRRRADEIVLWLSIPEFPNMYDDLPEKLRCLIGKNGFRIEWVSENIKSHKKYFYVLHQNENIIITVDDDMRYSEEMVSILMDSYRRHPYAVSARNVHIITKQKETISPYLAWDGEAAEYIGAERMDLCAIGVNGILYPPGLGERSWFDIRAIKENAENQDDLWLKFNEIVSGIPVVYTGLVEEDQVIEGSQSKPLYLQNTYGGDNDVCIHKLMDILKQEHEEIYRRWFEGLMLREEVWFARRNIYAAQLGNAMVQAEGRDIYICGAGNYAHILYDFIKLCGKEKCITGFLVTHNKQSANKDETSIKRIGELEIHEKFIVICGVGEHYREEFRETLKPYKFHKWVDVDLPGIERLLQQKELFLPSSGEES